MFDEMLIMASKGLVKVLFNLFLLYHCFPVILLVLSYHSIVGNGLGFRPKSQGHWHRIGNFSLWLVVGKPVGATLGFWTLSYP